MGASVRGDEVTDLGSAALSVVSGALMLVAPERMAKLYDLPTRSGLVRSLGVRDLLLGVALTMPAATPRARLLRAIAGTVDVGLIAGEALRQHARARREGLRMSTLASLTLYAAQSLGARPRASKAPKGEP